MVEMNFLVPNTSRTEFIRTLFSYHYKGVWTKELDLASVEDLDMFINAIAAQ